MIDRAPSQWASISDAVQHIVERSLLDEWGAEDLIERGLAAGKIRSRASARVKLAQAADLAPIGRNVPAVTPTTPMEELETEFWIGTAFSVSGYWKDEEGRATKVSTSGPDDFELENLQIHVRDLRRWLRDQSYIPAAPSMRGRPRHEAAWADLMVELIELERSGELTEDMFPDPKDLLRWFEADLNDKSDRGMAALDLRTARGVIESIWGTMVRGNRARGTHNT